MDQKLLFLINREWTSPMLDKLMVLASSEAFWAVPLVLFAIWLSWKGGFRGRVFVVVALVAFGITDGIVGRNLKHAVGRLRPHQSEFGVRVIELARPVLKGVFSPVKEKLSLGNADPAKTPGRSFPSNHSANTAAVALVATLLYRWGWMVFLPALLVSYSRIYTGAHWPSDVVAGVCLGSGVGLAAFVGAEWTWRRYGERIAPGVVARHPSLLTE
jgi:undecaprenyl-diphosphatase